MYTYMMHADCLHCFDPKQLLSRPTCQHFGFHQDMACGEHRHDRGELVQTCASVPLRILEYLLLKKYGEMEYDTLALDFMEM